MKTLFKNSEVMINEDTIYYRSKKYDATTLWGTTFSPDTDVDKSLKKSISVLLVGVILLFVALWLGIIVLIVGAIWTGLLYWQKKTGLIMTMVSASFHGEDPIVISFANMHDAELCFEALRTIRDKNSKA